MFPTRVLCMLLTVCCLFCLCGGVMAAEVDSDAIYCFTSADFSQSDDPLLGICITGLPEPQAGTVMLGSRILQKGDILTADQLAQMTFSPLRTEEDLQAQITYLPIYENRVERSATTALSIRGKKDEAPVATDSSVETYKNIPNEGSLKATDPEGETMTYTLVRAPKRGDVVLREDGSFVYTPKKNKVGVDSFTYTATDPAGNVSRQATVTIQILKPTNPTQYTDTAGLDCRFEAEWLRNTGLFEGEKISNLPCFFPEKAVTRGQFLAMMVQTLDIPTQEVSVDTLPENTPQWLQPYLTAAIRSGLTAGLPEAETFNADSTITGAEAAVMLQNGLDLAVSHQTLSAYDEPDEQIPAWAAGALTVLQENGITMDANAALTRADAAKVLYQVSVLAVNAPGTAVFKMQQ